GLPDHMFLQFIHELIPVDRQQSLIMSGIIRQMFKPIIGYLCSIPTHKLTVILSKLVCDYRCIGIFSGNAFFETLFRKYGVSRLIASDNTQGHHYLNTAVQQMKVKQLDYLDAIYMFEPQVLIICWPPMDNSATEALKYFLSLPITPKIMSYVGEFYGG